MILKKPVVIASISGGETSGMMAFLLKQQYSHTYDIKYVFMNTSREDERTLVFLDNLDRHFGLGVVWLEAVINPEKGKGIRHKITSFKDAKRNGELFEEHIAKYGLPSVKSPHCTRDLKRRTCESYMREINAKDAIIAIGYRYDEPKRVNLVNAAKANRWYPLYNHKVIKEQVKAFYSVLPFKLGLLEWQGNCKMCFKKSLRKLLTQLLLDPDSIIWIIDMELKYPINPSSNEEVLMFRGAKSIFDLIEMSKEPFALWEEPVYSNDNHFDFDLDEQESCAESCEAFLVDDDNSDLWDI